MDVSLVTQKKKEDEEKDAKLSAPSRTINKKCLIDEKLDTEEEEWHRHCIFEG